MLRISEISNLNNLVILKLEGKIVDLWVTELETQCEKYLGLPDSIIELDLENVSYVSEEGINLLNKLSNKIKLIKVQPFLEVCLKSRGLKTC